MRITEANYLNHFIKASTIAITGAVTEQDIARTRYLVLNFLGQRD